MPRPLRVEFENAWYYVTNRGAHGQTIFKTPDQGNFFLKLLADSSEIFGIEIHAYCLLQNQYHLLIKTPRANLARAMRHINGVYTQYFNRLEKKDGALFRGRYKAILLEEDHIETTRNTLHFLPVNEKIVSDASKFLWSSYRAYLQLTSQSWLHTSSTKVHTTLPTLEQITKASLAYFNLDEKNLFKGIRGKENMARKIAIYACRKWASEKISVIAKYYQCNSHANISNIVSEIDKKLKLDEKLATLIENLKKSIQLPASSTT